MLPPLGILWALYRSKIILHLREDTGQIEEKEKYGHSSLNVFLPGSLTGAAQREEQAVSW